MCELKRHIDALRADSHYTLRDYVEIIKIILFRQTHLFKTFPRLEEEEKKREKQIRVFKMHNSSEYDRTD